MKRTFPPVNLDPVTFADMVSIMVNKLTYKTWIATYVKDIMDKYHEMFRDNNQSEAKKRTFSTAPTAPFFLGGGLLVPVCRKVRERIPKKERVQSSITFMGRKHFRTSPFYFDSGRLQLWWVLLAACKKCRAVCSRRRWNQFVKTFKCDNISDREGGENKYLLST